MAESSLDISGLWSHTLGFSRMPAGFLGIFAVFNMPVWFRFIMWRFGAVETIAVVGGRRSHWLAHRQWRLRNLVYRSI